MQIKLKKKTECTRWTWFSWVLFITTILLVFTVFIRNIVPFLSREEQQDAVIMVVEGYIPDYAYPEIIETFYRDNYDLIITTGTTYDQGFYISDIETAAELIALSLRALGFDTTKIRMVPVPPGTHVNRTYNSAAVTYRYIQQNIPQTKAINIISLGVHARRSLYLFEKVYEPQIEVGNIVIPHVAVNRLDWYKSSRGFRSVINEMIAYVYVRFFFWPPKPE